MAFIPCRATRNPTTPGTSPTATRVTTYFSYTGPSAGFDETTYAPRPAGSGFKWMYIRAACTASAKITVTEADDEPRSVPQIDWNVFLLLQDDLPVGYVDVRKGPLGNPIESWTLFMKIPSKDTRYLSPGERSPSEPPAHYTLQYTLLPGTPFKTFAPGTEYVNVDADCSRGPL